MKKKKEIIVILTAVILTAFFYFFYIYPDSKVDTVELPESESPVHPLDTHLEQQYKSDLDEIKKRKYLRVLTTLNKTNFYINNGHLFGYEYSLLKDYEKFLNRNRKNNELKTVIEFIPVARDQLIPMLNNGYGDIAAAGLTVTPKRSEKVDFTIPYLTHVNEIAVTRDNSFNPEDKYDLSGLKVWVRKSSSYFDSLNSLNKELKDNGQKKVKIKIVDENIETESILEMIDAGAVSATIADSHIAKIWAEVLPDIQLHENAVLRKNSEIAWAVRKNNPKLKKSLDSFLQNHKKGSLLGNIYFNRYYKNSTKLKNPDNIETWENLKKYKKYIKKYAEKYNFDWLLIMALAFQESGFDSSKVSGKGAVGVLQVLPSTAGDKKIGIKNITKPENNIHAGVKYLDFIRNRYFSDENIKDKDRVRLTLAAYNAGPAKIRKARNLTEKMGLDRNKWFRNVELGTLRTVGHEPVEYVSNINKYYVLYQNLFEDEPSENN
ncbi:MAG: transglycosylase SLT domain-containing protein [Thermodesulfobacteriota bacterium]